MRGYIDGDVPSPRCGDAVRRNGSALGVMDVSPASSPYLRSPQIAVWIFRKLVGIWLQTARRLRIKRCLPVLLRDNERYLRFQQRIRVFRPNGNELPLVVLDVSSQLVNSQILFLR